MSSNFFLADRVKELSRVEGRVNIALDGAVDGFSSFGDFYASGDTVFYAITDNAQYEMGSGVYIPAGATDRALTRNVLRSSDINSGPYYLYGSGAGAHAGVEGHFYPMWLTKSAALSGVGLPEQGHASDSLGPYPSVHEHVFSGHPGVTFYMPDPGTTSLVWGHAVASPDHAITYVSDYVAASRPVDFSAGTKEVFVTYPGARAVFNTYGVESGVREPKESGIAIWKNGSVISYSPDLVWEDTNSHLGVKQGAPAFAIDVGGLKSFSQIRASGFIDGGSGILFSGVAGQFSGGRQLEPFLRNEVGETATSVIRLSGTVDEFIGFKNQQPTLVFAGPESDCGCDDAVPTFRELTVEDMPFAGDDGLDNRYVQQSNDGLGTTPSEYPYQAGMVALYANSGVITYDSGIIYTVDTNRLGLGGTIVGSIDPAYTLDVSGNMAANSGYFDQLLFTDNIIKIGQNTGNNKNNTVENYYTVNIGRSAGLGSSGNFDTVFIGHEAGFNIHRESGSLVFGIRAGEGSVSGFQNIIIGNHAASGASGIEDSVIMGHNAGQYANRGELHEFRFDNLVAIGNGAASGAGRIFYDNVAIGSNALSDTVQVSNASVIGKNAMSDASGIQKVVALGHHASESLNNSEDVVSIGRENLSHAASIESVDSIGQEALLRASGIEKTVAIGNLAGYLSREVLNGVFLGDRAGQEASGDYNIYLGWQAGINVSGHNNIEIIPQGHADGSILTNTANHAININNTIVGTANSGVPSTNNFSDVGIGIGYMEDASPPATLYVRPSGREDHPFIIRHQGSGGKAPYVALQSGDATTFFHITNSGDVVTSGFMNPSGGLLLEPITTTDWMDSTDNRLYNDGGTLKFDGDAIGGGGSMDKWILRAQIDDVQDFISNVEQNQTVIFSGVNGIDIQTDGARSILVDSSPLSGVLQDQIDDLSGDFDTSSYNFFHANIGPARDPSTGNVVDQTTGGAGKYAFARSELDEIPDEGVIAFSGVNGITVDLTTLSAGDYTSGIYEIGWDASSSYGWNVIASGEAADGGRNAIHPIPDGSGVAFSGVRGTTFSLWENTLNNTKVLISDPSELSGILATGIINSGNYIWSDHIDWRASGIAVSGLAVSNYDSIKGITSKSATSGIAIKDDKYVLDSGNGGQLSFLVLQDLKANDGDTTDTFAASSGNILITDRSGLLEIPSRGSNTFTTAIGPRVGEAASGHSYTVMIGHLAGGNSQANTFLTGESNDINRGNSVFIGRKAGHGFDSTVQSWDDFDNVSEYFMAHNILIGTEAGDAATGVGHSIGIGRDALRNSVRQIHNISLGSFSSEASVDSTGVVAIGNESNYDSRHVKDGVFIGTNAHWGSKNSQRNVGIGLNAMNSSSGLLSCVAIGQSAMQLASGALEPGSPPVDEESTFIVAVGYRAAYKSHHMGTEGGVYIGRDCALEASGTDNSVFIGNYAGQKTSHKNSIIISNKGLDLPITDVYPLDWADHDEDYVLDIAHGIQGKIQTGPHSYRDGVVNGYFSEADDVRIHIGPCVGLSEKQANHKLINKTVEIQPAKVVDAVLTLDQPFHPNPLVANTRERVGGRDTGVYAPGGPLLQVTTDTVQSTTPLGGDLRDNLAAGPNDTNLDIINRHGYPVMPMFGYYDTSNGNLHTNNSSAVLSDSDIPSITSIIPRYPGAYVMGYTYMGGAADWYLAICVEYEGTDPSSNNLVFSSDTNSSEYGLMWKFIKMT